MDDVDGELGDAMTFGEDSEVIFTNYALGFVAHIVERALGRH